MIACRDHTGAQNLRDASAVAIRIASARVLQTGDADSPSIIRIAVDVLANDRCHDHRVHLGSYLATKGLALTLLLDVMEGPGAGTSATRRRWRAAPRARDASTFVFSTMAPEYRENDRSWDPVGESASGFVFIVSAFVSPIEAAA